jgi:hypothetical protein
MYRAKEKGRARHEFYAVDATAVSPLVIQSAVRSVAEAA